MSGNFSPQAPVLRVTPATASEIKQIQALKARLEEPGSVALWRRPVDPEAARAALSAMLLHMNDGLRMPARDVVMLDTTAVGRAVTLRMAGEFIWIVNPVSSTGFTVADSRFYGWVDTRGQSFRRTHNAVCAHTFSRQIADTNSLMVRDAYAPASSKSAEWVIEAMRLTLAAIEAGAWLYEAMPDTPAAVMYVRPTVGLDENGVPHAERGPAIHWPGMPGMPEVYCSHGVAMQRRWVMEPETITAAMVTSENNAEQRRELMRLMGYERYVRDGGFTLVSNAEKEFGDRPPKGLQNAKLWQKVWRQGDPTRIMGGGAMVGSGRPAEAAVLLELQNSSKEPDGSYKTYFLRVPPEMRKVADAAAWTFGMSGKEYMGLAAET